MTVTLTMDEKLAQLSPALQAMILPEKREYVPSPGTPVSNFLVDTKRHCNGGRTIDAGLWLRDHCNRGGKMVVSLAGAASSFEIGVSLCPLIRDGLVAAISATGANMEESFYRALAGHCYRRIPQYEKLTSEQEKELERAGLRRITDTFLPEEETVRIILPLLEVLWDEAADIGKPRLWHEFFFELFERKLVTLTPEQAENCWLYQAWKHGVEVFVPGSEDSTMGNIFAHATYAGSHPCLSAHSRSPHPISVNAVLPGTAYMHRAVEWYKTHTAERSLAFVQLGGGIAGDFLICVVPHLRHDFLHDVDPEMREKMIRAWAGFVEIHLTPMSAGSYSGAGHCEKITWSKFEPGSVGIQIFGDFTSIFPDIAALVLRM